MRRAVIIGVAAALLSAAPSLALADVPVEKTRSDLRVRETRIRTARRAVEQTQSNQATLEHRITALKRLAADNRLSDRSELERLLRESVAADRALADRRRAVTGASDDLTRWARRTIREIDVEVKRRVPDMKRGSINSRKNAARRIAALMKLRKELDAASRRRPTTSATVSWAKYVDVKIDPLDGPTELAEKADFLEDTRDKYDKKRRAILQLLAQAKRENEIRRAAGEFRDDRSIFDDESRSVRVPRTTGALASATNDKSGQDAEAALDAPAFQAAETPGGQRNSDPSPPPETGVLQGPTTTDDTAARTPPPAAEPQPAPSPTPTRTAATPAPAEGPAVRGVDAQRLIGLRIEELGNQNLDPATLKRLLAELYALDKHLAAQAKTMRQRAEALEADEARATDAK